MIYFAASSSDALGIDPYAILAQGVTFLVLLLILKKYALVRIVKTLEERRKTINRGLGLTAELDKLKTDLESKTNEVLAEARKEAAEIIKTATDQSHEIIHKAEVAAMHRSDALMTEAGKKIDREIESARIKLRAEAADLVAEATESVLRESVTASKDKKLIDKYLSELSA